MNRENAYKLLSSIGQEHVLRYFDELSEDQQKILLSQIEETDFSVLSRLSETQTDLNTSGNDIITGRLWFGYRRNTKRAATRQSIF